MENKPIYAIILDAGPILKNDPPVDSLIAKTETLITAPSVLSEIKDQSASLRAQTLLKPFLTLRRPRLHSLQFVIGFAKKCGDYSVLSRTDLEVLALTYELECERNGGDQHLRKTPGQKGCNSVRESRSKEKPNQNSEEPATSTPTDTSGILQPSNLAASQQDHKFIDLVELSHDLRDLTIQNINSNEESETVAHTVPLTEPPFDQSLGLKPETSVSHDSNGWITEANLHQHRAKDLNGSTAPVSLEPDVQIACLTNDFAMQNVLLQIGLNLLSPSLQRIRNIRTYILRCHACFQQVKDTSKRFCPRCGKPTLTRVSCSTNQKGEFRIHLKKNMQWNHRGDRYSIPKPVAGSANGKAGQGKGGGKGGWGKELIFAEDQKEYQQALGVMNSVKAKDLMDEDYLPSILTGDRGRAGGRPKIGAGRNVNAKKRAS